MSITSFSFVLFVLLSLTVYYVVPTRFQWVALLVASVAFYISFSFGGIIVLTATALATWFVAVQIQKQKDLLAEWMRINKGTASKEERKAKKDYYAGKQKRLLATAVVLNLALLILFKYYGKAAVNLNRIAGINLWTAENLLLPLGISYYALQLIGYVCDVQRDVIRAEENPLKVVLFGAFFLSIMQGPFNRYGSLMPQLDAPNKMPDRWKIQKAIYRILWGYVKKMCIADQVGILAREVFTNYPRYSGLGIIAGIVCFAIQLYADFSGYMDIVLGIGQLFGLELPENFRQPFFSRNMSEFWRRWHITLGGWLKDYVLYPILKSKLFKNLGKILTEKFGKNAGRNIPIYLGDLILWIVIGAWHGAGFNYVFGVGFLQFFYIFFGELLADIYTKGKNVLHMREDSLILRLTQSVKVTALMLFAWVFFNSASFGDAFGLLNRVFADKVNLSQVSVLFSQESLLAGASVRNFMVYIALCIAVLFAVDILHERGIAIGEQVIRQGFWAEAALFIALFFALVIFGAYGDQYSASNFIYFDF